ncbi:MAG TPA: hypothetical protein VNZ54_00430 [bacterium]|nr:hypothetical protein [bacterium]
MTLLFTGSRLGAAEAVGEPGPWGGAAVAVEPFAGYTTLAMGLLSADLQNTGYRGSINQGFELGLEVPVHFGSFYVAPRLYGLWSGHASRVNAYSADLAVGAVPLELGAGYTLRQGRWSLNGGLYAGGLLGWYDDEFVSVTNAADHGSSTGSAWTYVGEGKLGCQADLGHFFLGLDLGYRYAVIPEWSFTRKSSTGPTTTQVAKNAKGQDSVLDYSGGTAEGQFGYRF